MARPDDVAAMMQAQVTQLLNTVNALNALSLEWTAGGYGTLMTSDRLAVYNMDEGTIPDGQNSIAAIETLLEAGHRLNLLKVMGAK